MLFKGFKGFARLGMGPFSFAEDACVWGRRDLAPFHSAAHKLERDDFSCLAIAEPIWYNKNNGHSIIWAAPVCAMIIAVTSGLNVLHQKLIK